MWKLRKRLVTDPHQLFQPPATCRLHSGEDSPGPRPRKPRPPGSGAKREKGRYHPGNVRRVSPRFAHEFSRIPLLAELPGETLAKLAAKMKREQIPAGGLVVQEGDDGDRFYVVLSGMLSVSQESLGARRVLRPGDYFGEVALALDVARTASVRALTPATVASCDRKTFDELIRPLFSD
jgi:hypothetical protein